VEDEDSDEDGEPMELLGGSIPGPLPLLETLTMRGMGRGGLGFYGPDFLDLLRLAPNLTECLFHDMTLTEFDYDVTEKLVFPRLRRLMFGESGTCPYSEDYVLKHLSLPALETLSLSMDLISYQGRRLDDLVSFLKRSSPPLQELVLGFGCKELDFVGLAECLRLIPTLMRLEAWRPRGRVAEQLFAALAESPSLLPNLHTLTIHLSAPEVAETSDSFWTKLSLALAARRAQFRVFHLKIPVRLPDSWMPAPDITAAFRELAADGAQICIGDIDGIWNHTFELVPRRHIF